MPHAFRRAATTIALASLLFAAPVARASWTRVAAVPATDVYTVRVQGDTLLAGLDNALFLSTDGGASWSASAPISATPRSVEALWMHHGRIYAGLYGGGVFVSDDLGGSWSALNTGLTGGMFDSHLLVTDFAERAGRLYASTDGAGVYVLDLAAPTGWAGFHREDQIAGQASTVLDLGAGGTRLVSVGGANGTAFHNDDPLTGWTEDFLDNAGIVPSLQPFAVASSGAAWVVATSAGCFRRASAGAPWAYVGPPLGTLMWASLAAEPGRVFAALQRPQGVMMHVSRDAGLTWARVDTLATNVYELAIRSGTLIAARGDGLWTRAVGMASAPPPARRAALGLAHAGRHPAGDEARLRFTLPAATRATLEVFDLGGRRLDRGFTRDLPAGEHQAALDLSGLESGVYLARLTAGDAAETLRLVRMQ